MFRRCSLLCCFVTFSLMPREIVVEAGLALYPSGDRCHSVIANLLGVLAKV